MMSMFKSEKYWRIIRSFLQFTECTIGLSEYMGTEVFGLCWLWPCVQNSLCSATDLLVLLSPSVQACSKTLALNVMLGSDETCHPKDMNFLWKLMLNARSLNTHLCDSVKRFDVEITGILNRLITVNIHADYCKYLILKLSFHNMNMFLCILWSSFILFHFSFQLSNSQSTCCELVFFFGISPSEMHPCNSIFFDFSEFV